MPVIIDPLEQRRGPRGLRKLLLLVLLLGALLFAARSALSYWVDLLWFRSLSYGDVFWTTWRLQWGTFLVFTAITFLILYAAFFALKRAYQGYLPSDSKIMIGGQPVNFSVEPVLRIVGIVASIVIAGISGASMASDWPTLALFWYAPRSAGSTADPIFGKLLNFFLFTLPAAELMLGWLLTLSVITCVAAAVFAMIAGGARALDKRSVGHSYAPSPWRGLSFAAAPLLLLLAVDVYLSRFQSLLEHHTIFDGITYTDAHVTLNGLLIVCAALVLGAGIATINTMRRPSGNLIAAAIAPAAVCYLLLGMVGWYVSNFIVKPNELVREEPYIG